MSTKSLSVVIPAYNAGADITGTLDALQAAIDGAPSFTTEIVLVDDGSTDGTAEIARLHRAPVRVISQENRGRFEARRAGLEAATGDWVLLLDTRITLDPDSLVFLAERLDEGETVWNGHVEVITEGNPYGAFWKTVAKVAWKDYLVEPRTTSFGADDFDRFPKGTGCFLAPRLLLLEAVGQFVSHYDSTRVVSDDTAVIRWVAERNRIHLSPRFSCSYAARSNLPSFFRQGIYRGTTFVDGHMRKESRFFAGAVAFFPLSVALAVATRKRPLLALLSGLAGALAAGAAAASVRSTPYEVRWTAALSPVYAVAHGAGMWRGLVMLATARLRRGGTR